MTAVSDSMVTAAYPPVIKEFFMDVSTNTTMLNRLVTAETWCKEDMAYYTNAIHMCRQSFVEGMIEHDNGIRASTDDGDRRVKRLIKEAMITCHITEMTHLTVQLQDAQESYTNARLIREAAQNNIADNEKFKHKAVTLTAAVTNRRRRRMEIERQKCNQLATLIAAEISAPAEEVRQMSSNVRLETDAAAAASTDAPMGSATEMVDYSNGVQYLKQMIVQLEDQLNVGDNNDVS